MPRGVPGSSGGDIPRPAAPVEIELAIRLSDGSFVTSIKVPLNCSPEVRDASVKRWLHLASEAMKMGVDSLDATLPNKAEGSD